TKELHKISHTEKETAGVRRGLKRENKKFINKEINKFLKKCEDFTANLAKKFSIKVKKARALVNAAANIKQEHQMFVTHWLAAVQKKLNKEMVEAEIENGNYEDLDDNELRDELKDVRELKTKGARSMNRAAAVDHKGTLCHMEVEITNLKEAQTLRKALTAGKCKWVKMLHKEKELQAKSRQEKVVSREVPPKVQKKRSDAGKKWGPQGSQKSSNKQKCDDDSDSRSDKEGGKESIPAKSKHKANNGSKKCVASQLPPMPKSKDFVDTNSSDDNA
ncbi:hypothetical protein C0991_002960, partial [Blastosporella zonata]